MRKKRSLVLAAALAAIAMPAAADYVYRVPLLSTHSGGLDSGGSFTPPPEVEVQDGSEPGACDLTKAELDDLTNTDLAFSKFPEASWGWDCKNGIYASQTQPALFYRDSNITTGFRLMVNRNEGGFAVAATISPESSSRLGSNKTYSSCTGTGTACGIGNLSNITGMIARYDPDSMVPLELGSAIDVDDPLIISMNPAGFSLHKTPIDTLTWPAGLDVGQEVALGGTFTVQQNYLSRAYTAERSFDGGVTFEPAAGQVRAVGDEFFYTPATSDREAQIRLSFTVMDRWGKIFTDLKSDLSGPVIEPFRIQDKTMYVGTPYSDSGSPVFPLVEGGSGDSIVTVTNMPSIPGISEVDGFLIGTPTAAGSWSIDLSAVDQATNESITGTFDLTIEAVDPLFFVGVTPNGDIPLNSGALTPIIINYQPELTGGVGEITWSMSGSLPAGINFNPNTGKLSGSVPTSLLDANPNGATYSITVTAEDEAGTQRTKTIGFVLLEEDRGSVDSEAFKNSVHDGTGPQYAGNSSSRKSEYQETLNLGSFGLTAPYTPISVAVNGDLCPYRHVSFLDRHEFCSGRSYNTNIEILRNTGQVTITLNARRTEALEFLYVGANGRYARIRYRVKW